jgi:hypothetical protein
MYAFILGVKGHQFIIDLAKPAVKDVQSEIIKYGNHNP